MSCQNWGLFKFKQNFVQFCQSTFTHKFIHFIKIFLYFSFEYYEEGGPIFIQIGGEGEISSDWLNYGAWIDWAKKEKAALFILEHRYYGESHPTPTLATEEMRWLSSR